MKYILLGCSGEGRFAHRLVKIDRPVLRIPTLCIHLRTQEERDAFKVNKEDHLMPILCAEIKKALLPGTNTSENEPNPTGCIQDTTSWVSWGLLYIFRKKKLIQAKKKGAITTQRGKGQEV
jgi:aspartyl aminopeptidase